jgi:hypothetical protein
MKMLFKNPRLWWKFEGRYYHKDLYYGVRNLIKWFPVIWKDRDWDFSYIYKVLQFKLEQQAYGIGSRDIHVGASRNAEIMRMCARLCKLQQEGEYEMEYLDYLQQDIEFVPTDETKKWYTMESTQISDDLDEYFARYPRQYKRVMNGEITWYGKPTDTSDRKEIAMVIANENQIRSRKLLFKTLEKSIEGWWD